MATVRTAGDLSIHDGPFRSFEWFWGDDESMPGLDAFERLTSRDQDDFVTSVVHWGNTPVGITPTRSRINIESTNPAIVVIKAGKQRFTAFREDAGPRWIVHAHYVKEGERRDKTGNRAIESTKRARQRYLQRMKDGTYYERG
jgi:hypothetical protein